MEKVKGIGSRLYWWSSKRKDRLVRPIVESLARLGVHAYLLTLISFISGMLGVIFLFRDNGLFVTFMVLHLFFDNLDGAMARHKGTTTELSSYADTLCDRSVNAFFFIKLYLVFETDKTLQLIVLFFIFSLVYFISNARNHTAKRHFIFGPVYYMYLLAAINLIELGIVIGWWHYIVAIAYLLGSTGRDLARRNHNV
ncbi:MAG: CDP-alcohol phosphatidyltransferase family protein [Nanoarchaeota archaeon]|nr:CDP-alcohol phosphatidyltransferase family protein [Nanoarchaeota archaeon]